jgi:hypothetical protein
VNTGDAAGDVYFVEGLIGSNSADTLIGDSADNILVGGGGDSLNGGGGFDYASYFTSASGVTANLSNSAANAGAVAVGDTYFVEGLIGSNFNDTLIGDSFGNVLQGLDGNDRIDGGTGIWKTANGQWAGSADVGSHPAGYSPVLAGDFSGDGTSDIAWYNAGTSDVDIWKISNGQWAGSSDVGPHPAGYTPVGVADFNGDGTSDILWFNPRRTTWRSGRSPTAIGPPVPTSVLVRPAGRRSGSATSTTMA